MIVCVLESGRHSGAAAAYAAWLSESLGVPLRLEGVDMAPELLDAAPSDAAGLLVIAAGGPGEAEIQPVLSVIGRAHTPVIVLPPPSTGLWEADPQRARGMTKPTVVCGADGSSTSVGAVARAAELAARLDGGLVLVHAVGEAAPHDPASSATPLNGLSNSLRAADRGKLLLRTVASLHECPSELSFTERYGEAVEVLDGVGGRESAALIAVGSAGFGPDRPGVRGSIAAGLVARGTRPVLVVQARMAKSSPTNATRSDPASSLRAR